MINRFRYQFNKKSHSVIEAPKEDSSGYVDMDSLLKIVEEDVETMDKGKFAKLA